MDDDYKVRGYCHLQVLGTQCSTSGIWHIYEWVMAIFYFICPGQGVENTLTLNFALTTSSVHCVLLDMTDMDDGYILNWGNTVRFLMWQNKISVI